METSVSTGSLYYLQTKPERCKTSLRSPRVNYKVKTANEAGTEAIKVLTTSER